VIVRRAVEADLSQYLVLANRFHATSPVHNVIPFDDKGYSEFYRGALANEALALWVAEDSDALIGIAGAIAYPMYFSPTHKVVQELWWWLEPQSRGSGAGKEMFNAIDQWAKEVGAAALLMAALEDNRTEKMHNVYARAGFTPMERTFIREVAQ